MRFFQDLPDMKYFTEEEFNHCVPFCEMSDCNDLSLARLDALRHVCGFPLVLSSAYRSPAYDKSKGRSGRGAHTLGRAFDIFCADSDKRFKIVKAAMEVGFNRIGIASRFIHVDDCGIIEGKPDCIIWLYPDKK